MASKARLEIPAQEAFAAPAADFVLSFASRLVSAESNGDSQAAAERLRTGVTAAISMVMANNAGGKSDQPLVLEVSAAEGRLSVALRNRGVPILLGSGKNPLNNAYYAHFQEASRHADRLFIENLGRRGQNVVLDFRVGNAAGGPPPEPTGSAAIPEREEITLRLLGPADAESLSRLFYVVYGYDYINEAVYYPEKLRSMLESGELLSVAATRANGRLVGHVGLVRKSETPGVYEAAMGVVDPAVKSRGLFAKLFARAMELVNSTPMQYCLFDFVTNHDLTQRHIARYGFRELALFAGCQSSKTQARLPKLGLGADPERMDRYSLLVAVIPRVENPFGTEVRLPESLGEPLGFLLKPLGLDWIPSPRFENLPAAGRYNTRLEPGQGSAIFDLETPGRAAVAALLREWRELLRQGYRYAGVDVPVAAQGLAMLYETIAAEGFFAAGLVPYRFSDRLGLRFQSLGPADCAFDKIRVATEPAKKLLDFVRRDWEANRVV